MSYLIALIICAAAAAGEGACAGRDPMAQLKRLRQPRWAPPTAIWVLIGLAWYGICFVALVRLLGHWPEQRAPLLLLVALMLANGAANLFQFRLRRLDLAFFFYGPYWLLLALFLWTACPLDRLTCLLFLLYAAYQPYAATWSYRLWRMNGATARSGA